MSTTPSFTDLATSRGGGGHSNPMYDFLSGFAPRKLKDLFKWVEYLYYNSAHIFAALKKFAEYAVTEIVIDSNVKVHKDNWDRVLNTKLRMRRVSISTGLDLFLYGNSFCSPYHPFNRSLHCEFCRAKANVKKVKYTFDLKSLTFTYTCPACDKKTKSQARDEKVADEDRINIIRWDPKLIDISHNPITGESKYYYTIPDEIKGDVKKGKAHIVGTMPMEFLRAIKENQQFEFADGQIYHMKLDPPAGIDSKWGFPPLTATIKLFFYTAVLRKANEAIALEHIVPFRVIHPVAMSGSADPTTTMNLMVWQDNLRAEVKKWRRDPLHIMFAPAALGVTMMGGQGRSLLTLGEVKDAEDNIIAAMGIPREFLYGGLSFTGSSITLRMLENQLETYAGYMNDQLDWIVKQVAQILSWKPVDVYYTPFRLIDDVQQKQSMMNLNAMGPIVANGTLLELHNLNINDERDKRKQEQLDEARFNMELEIEMSKIQASLSQEAQNEANAGVGTAYNPQAVIAMAEQFISEMEQMDPNMVRSQLDQLSQEDPVMYAVVKDRWETMRNMQKRDMTSSMGGS